MSMKRFIVVSYDHNEQQSFFDPIEAVGPKAAELIAGTVRGDYAFICAVLDTKDILRFAGILDESTPREPGFFINRANAKQKYEEYLCGVQHCNTVE